MHVYERRAYEMAAYERHAYEMAYGRCMPIKCPSIGDVCLGDAFNQSIQIAFTIGTPKWVLSIWKPLCPLSAFSAYVVADQCVSLEDDSPSVAFGEG